MKAKTFDNRPHGWSSYIYDNSGKHIGYFEIGLPNEERADAYTNSFNSALSDHVAKETASKDKQIEIQQAHIDDQDQLIFDQTKEIADLKENINRLIEAHVSAEEDFSWLKSNIKTVSDENITGVVDETFKGLGSLINDEDLFYFYKQLIITMYAGMVVDKNMEIHNLQAEIDRLKKDVERLIHENEYLATLRDSDSGIEHTDSGNINNN